MQEFAYVRILGQAQRTGELLANLFHIAQLHEGGIVTAQECTDSYLVGEKRFWRRTVREPLVKRLLDVDPREVANCVRTRYRGQTNAQQVGVGCFALLSALDGLAGCDSHEAVGRMLHGPHRVHPDLGTAEYRVLVKPFNFIHNEVKTLHDKDRFRLAAHLAPHVGHLLDHLMFVTIPAGRNVVFVDPDPALRQLLHDRRNDLRVGIFPLRREFEYSFSVRTLADNKAGYHFAGISNEGEIWTEIERILDACRRGINGMGPVSIIVFPELAVSPELESRITNWLSTNNHDQGILLVVAGSFHRCETISGDRPHNVSNVWRFDGKHASGADTSGRAVRWTHRKMNAFRLTEGNLKEMRKDKCRRCHGLLHALGEHTQTAVEDIEPGDQIVLFDLPIGRAATVICLDYLDDETITLLCHLGVSMVFVPAMSHDTQQSRRVPDRRLGRECGASVFCANSAWIVPDGDEVDGSSYYYLPFKKGCRAHTDFVGPAAEPPPHGRCALDGLVFDITDIRRLAEGTR